MGQRVNPFGIRLKINKTHNSVWYTRDPKQYAAFVAEDHRIRGFIGKKFRRAGVSSVVIARSKQITVTIYAKFVGYIIGKKGSIIDALRLDLEKMCGCPVNINVKEVAKPDLDAAIVANDIALALEGKGASFKVIVKRTMQTTMDAGALGIKLLLSGRLGGAEIARKEPFSRGSVPLQTFQADISSGQATAFTQAGTIGVKVSIYRGMYRGKYNPFEHMTDKISQQVNSQVNQERFANK